MSRLAKRPILFNNVEVKNINGNVQVKGPKGNLSLQLKHGIDIDVEKNQLLVKNTNSTKAFHGLYWALVKNLILGVTQGFEKKLILMGVGYKAAVKGSKLDIQVGFSHATTLDIPEGITVKIDKATEITIAGIDKQLVGQFAATVRALKKPEPYKGKGIRYLGEYVRKKAGKAGKAKT